MADAQSYEYTNSDPDHEKTDLDPDSEENHLDPDNESNDLNSDNQDDRNGIDLSLFGNEYDWNDTDLDFANNERDQNNTDLDLTDNERDRNDADLNLPDNEDQNATNFNQPHSARSRLRKEKYPSSVWHHFTKTQTHPKQPVCKRCKTVFARKTATSTLRRHLNTHKIIAPKRRQRSLHDYRNDAYTEHEQQKRDNRVIR